MKPMEPDFTIPELDPCWLQMPGERSRDFLAAFVPISLEIQKLLRARVPPAYFADFKRFRDVKTAYPMLVFQVSRPFHCRVRTELAYDVMNPAMLPAFLRGLRPSLVVNLRQVAARLRAEGLPNLAEKYSAGMAEEILRAVQQVNKTRRWLNTLIRAEALLMDALLGLAGFGSLTENERLKKLAVLSRKWSRQLRHFYPRQDYTFLAPLILQAATAALRSHCARKPATQPRPRRL